MSLLFIHFHKQLSDLHMCPYFESGLFNVQQKQPKLDLYNFKCLEQQIVCGRSLTLVSVFLFCHRLNFFFYVNINFNDKIVDQERLTVSRLM